MTRFVLAVIASAVLAPVVFGQGNFDPPPPFPPDDATMKQIAAKTAELRAAVGALPKETKRDVRADVEVYLKAAEWIVRHNEFYAKDSGRQTLGVLDAGLARSKAAREGKTPWRDVRGKPVVRGYYSEVDGSVQPYSVTLPPGFGEGDKMWRLDIVLHGRDQGLTEVKFINAHETAKAGRPADYVTLEPYGRGNNAYRWAGEKDVFEAQFSLIIDSGFKKGYAPIAGGRTVIRGFSMGGAGTWHLGLHYPNWFAAMQPGAGFTTTRGYVKNLPEPLPEYVEKCLHIYDAVDYAENALIIPVVAYSGEKDPQKAAADNIETALKRLTEPAKFTHIVAPGLEHKQPQEWLAKCNDALANYIDHPTRKWDDRSRFVTYTTRYTGAQPGYAIWALDKHYEKSIVDCRWASDGPSITTTNIRSLQVYPPAGAPPLVPMAVNIDGQRLAWLKDADALFEGRRKLVKNNGRWGMQLEKDWKLTDFETREKVEGLQGPIDDAFMGEYKVVGPTGEGWHTPVTKHAAASLGRFEAEWDKFFRGSLPIIVASKVNRTHISCENLVLFGDPGSNSLIAEVVAKLPITWTKDKLIVNGVEYDPKTHVPVLIYPNPLIARPSKRRYVVINSGHTFRAADLKGTNALLYPRLGDWAVLKVAPTAQDSAAAEVIAAGLFDEFWQFPKK